MKLTGRVVTPTRVLDPGEITVDGGRIAAVGRTRPGRERTADAAWILPGFVDIHVHGGGGHTFTTGDPDAARAAAAFHAGHGTTTLLASLVTAPIPALRDVTVALGPLVAEGVLAGLHFEGPYLSHIRCGAQNSAYLRDPDPAELTGLLDRGGVRMVTIAPELPGAIDTIRLLRDHGVVAAIGHTDASYEQTVSAIEAGATVGTHVCNGMRPMHHREPGPIVALIEAPGVVCELIADGVHLHDAMLNHLANAAGPDRVALITDAIAAAGMSDGTYELGGQAVTVAAGVARLRDDAGAVAGSTVTMDAVLRRVIHGGHSIVDAARMLSGTPARVLGLDTEVGAIEVGRRADLVLLDDELSVIGVLRAGVPYPGN